MKSPFKFISQVAGIFFILAIIFTGCDKDDDDGMPENLIQYNNISINGAEEVPSNSSTATGTFNGTYNMDTKILTYSITYSGITPTAMHFHEGAAGVSGGVVVPIGAAPYTSPIEASTPALTADQEADLLAGLWYVNIHSTEFPAGEIRGQVVY